MISVHVLLIRLRQQIEPLHQPVFEMDIQVELLHLQADCHSVLRLASEVPELLHHLQHLHRKQTGQLAGFTHDAKGVPEVLVQVEIDVVALHLWPVPNLEKVLRGSVCFSGLELLEVVEVEAAGDGVEDEVACEKRKRDLLSCKRKIERVQRLVFVN